MRAIGDTIDLPVRYRRTKITLTLVTAALALIAVASSFLAFSYQRHIVEASRYNRTFDLGQTAVELLRLQFALQQSQTSGDIGDVAFRLSIINNRLKILSSSSSSSDPKQKAMLEDLKKLYRRWRRWSQNRILRRPCAKAYQNFSLSSRPCCD